MEGLVTIVVATISYFTILDFPDRAHVGSKFLTKAECEQIMQAIDTDRNDAAKEPWDFKKWISSGADLVVWSFALIFFGLTAITYGMSAREAARYVCPSEP
jgi:hypothetical protein